MSVVIGAISKPLEFLLEPLRKYIESRKIRGQLLNSLYDEINDFQQNFQGISTLTNDAIIPIIEKSKNSPIGIDEVNQIVDCMNLLYPMFSELWESFIRLVRGMHEVSSLSAFMENLKETNSMLFDFTVSMGNMLVDSDKVMIDYNFLRFFKVYEKQFSKGVSAKKMDEIAKKLEEYIELTQKNIVPLLNKRIIKRRARKMLRVQILNFLRSVSKVRIEMGIEDNFREYVPSQFLALVVVIDNTRTLESSIEPSDKNRISFRK